MTKQKVDTIVDKFVDKFFDDYCHMLALGYSKQLKLALTNLLKDQEERIRKEVLEEVLLGVLEGHTPDYIIDHPDGRIRKAYEKLLKPQDYTGGVNKLLKEEE